MRTETPQAPIPVEMIEDVRLVLLEKMRQYREYQAQIAEVEREAELQRAEITAWLDAVDRSAAERTAVARSQSKELSEEIERLARLLVPRDEHGKPTRKHEDIPGLGRVKWVKRSAGMRIVDAEAFMGSLGADERARLVEQRPHLRTNDAKQYALEVMQATGEVVAGVERIDEDEWAHPSITLSGGV